MPYVAETKRLTNTIRVQEEEKQSMKAELGRKQEIILKLQTGKVFLGPAYIILYGIA